MAYSYPSSFTTFYPYHPNTTTVTSSFPSYPWESPPSYSPNIPFTTPSQNFSYNHGYTPHQQSPFTLPPTTIPLTTSPPYTSYTPSPNPYISYQQQPQNVNSQSETFYQDLETLKQYLIETHELSNKYREELKEHIQNLSYSLKTSSQEFRDAQKKRTEKLHKSVVETKPKQQQQEEEEKLKEKYGVRRTTEEQTEETKGLKKNSNLKSPATTPIGIPAASPTSIPAASPTTSQSFSPKEFRMSSPMKTDSLSERSTLSSGKLESLPVETIVLPPKLPDSSKPPPKPPDLQRVQLAPSTPPPFIIPYLLPPLKPPDFQYLQHQNCH